MSHFQQWGGDKITGEWVGSDPFEDKGWKLRTRGTQSERDELLNTSYSKNMD